MDAIKKYAVWAILAAGIVYNFGWMVVNWWPQDAATWQTANTVLGFLGLGSVRLKLADTFAGIDLGDVGTWITGKKTYITSILGTVFLIGGLVFHWNMQMPWVQFVTGLLGSLGFFVTLPDAMMTYKKQALKLVSGSGLAGNPPALARAIFTKAAAVVALIFLLSVGAQAQTWENFWHPRPHQMGISYRTTASSYLWEFKPSLVLSASCFRPSTVSGDPITTTFLSAAGPGLTLQHTSTAADGSNYADYSANLVFLITGNTQDSPTLRPAVALMAGVFNNIAEVGAGYDLVARPDKLSRFFFLISIGVNLTNNP